MVHINLFPTSAPSLTLLAIWAVSNAAAFGMNISLQIIREDYHPVNIVFQVAICHPFSSSLIHLINIVFRLFSRAAISSASFIWSGEGSAPLEKSPPKYHLHISKFFTGSTGSTRRVRLQWPQNKKCQLVRQLKQNLVFLEIFHCILSHNSLFYFCLVLLLNQNPRGNRVRCSHGRKLSRRWDMRLPNTFLYFKGARDHVLVVKDVFLNFLRLNQGMDNLTTLF